MIDEPRSLDAFERAIVQQQARNGTAEAYAPEPARLRGPRMPGAREKWVTLPPPYGDTDPPMKVRIWVNYPNRFADDLVNGDEDAIYEVLSKIVLEHNGWLDEDGKPLPALARGDAEVMRRFWQAIPNECAQAISGLVGVEAGKVSASIRARPRR